MISKPISTRQSGSALIISLVLLMVLTLIGVSSVEKSILEEKMSTNTQFKTMTFQTAKSETEAQFSSLDNNANPIIDSLDGDVAPAAITAPAGMAMTNQLSFVGQFERKARTKDQIQSLGSAKVYVTELTTTSTMTNSGATSQQTLGTELPAPST